MDGSASAGLLRVFETLLEQQGAATDIYRVRERVTLTK